MKLENKEMYVALLDITKAYDRVCRDSLWFKLSNYGFPPKVLNLLQALYRDPVSILHFQDVQTEPLHMELGL